MSDFAKMRTQMERGAGFIAALDQSGGSTPKALALYGVEPGDYSGDDEMFAEMQRMRARIIESPDFTGDKVIGAILFEKTMHEKIGGELVASHLWNTRRVVPFLKIDKGLQDEAQGVQLLKPMPGLAERLAEARDLGIFGTKERSVIQSADADGIRAIADDQFAVAHEVLSAGLVPIIEPEINIHSDTKAACEDMLAEALMAHIAQLSPDQDVILKLTLPDTPGHYDALADHPRVLRVVALSGGYTTDQASAKLAENHKMIASFSRALTEGLRRDMDGPGFVSALGKNINQIYQASVA